MEDIQLFWLIDSIGPLVAMLELFEEPIEIEGGPVSFVEFDTDKSVGFENDLLV